MSAAPGRPKQARTVAREGEGCPVSAVAPSQGAFRVHAHNPSDLVEQTYFRVHQERMADVPILNAALSVEAIDFQRWQGHWLGIVVTPWCMSVLLVPGSTDNWVWTGENKRRFVKFPAGEFAFLGSEEAELGEFQSCSLFSPMGKFSNQVEAAMTARASMVALLTAPPAPEARAAESSAAAAKPPVAQKVPVTVPVASDRPALSRRGFFSLRAR
ncbi:MAG: [NiFe]-hydrogenase assembly chaperone HybE [Rhodoferax sp.]|nr:[NiFe]-hydrogenase assembly chaperone HybE [Rhodoferax sp.]